MSSLRYRIAATIFALEAVMIVVVLWTTLSSSLESIKQQVAAADEVTVKMLAELGRIALLTDEYNDLQPFLENAVLDPHVLRVLLVDNNNVIHASSDARGFGTVASDFSDTAQTYWQGMDITNASGKLGRLWVRFSNAGLEEAFFQARRLGFAIAISGMFIIAVAGVGIGMLLSRRLERLNQVAAEFARGNLDVRCEQAGGRDEVGELARTFNAMADEVQSTLSTLKESETRFRNIFEYSNDAILLIDIGQMRIIDANRRATQMLDYPYDALCNLPVTQVCSDDASSFQHFVEQFRLRGAATAEDLVCVSRLQKRIDVSISASMLEMDGNSVMLAQVRDISERKQSERALQRAQKMEAIGQLTGGIAHDFNNILGIVLGNLSLLERQVETDDKARKRFATINHAAERAVSLTRKLLSFSRQENANKVICNINNLVEGMETLIVRSLTPQVEVEHKLAPNLWLTEIDPGDCEDALLNLVLNARDAMSGAGRLSIETANCTLDEAYCRINPGSRPGEYVQLSVSDDGEGMSEALQERIFEPFFTTKEQGKGTGLGMAMVFGFVKRSGGYIKVYSEPGIGTTVRLYLPRASSEAAAQDLPQEKSTHLPTGDETILVVDDEIELLELVEETLSELGYTVYTAKNALKAMEVLDAHPEIDLLFSDVVMPGGINGYQLAEHACKQKPALKVVLTSGYTDMAMARNGQARFNANLLSKPYTLASLARRLREMLDT